MGRVPSILEIGDFPECGEESCGCQEPTLTIYSQDFKADLNVGKEPVESAVY
jgi:hypothetical protein